MQKKSPLPELSLDKIFAKNLKIARRVLQSHDLNGKVLCFIPSWEVHANHGQEILKIHNLPYYLVQLEIYESILADDDFVEGALSFTAFRRKASDKIEVIADDNALNRKYLVDITNEIRDREHVDILWIDYDYFCRFSLLSEYIKWSSQSRDKSYKPNPELMGLWKLFSRMPFDARTFTYSLITAALRGVYKNTNNNQLNIEKVIFASANVVTAMSHTPFINQNFKRGGGYLCQYNSADLQGQKHNEMGTLRNKFRMFEVRRFYTLESLLCFELYSLIKRSRRCKNCNSLLPLEVDRKRYKGQYCTRISNNKCYKDRQVLRVNKYRKHKV